MHNNVLFFTPLMATFKFIRTFLALLVYVSHTALLLIVQRNTLHDGPRTNCATKNNLHNILGTCTPTAVSVVPNIFILRILEGCRIVSESDYETYLRPCVSRNLSDAPTRDRGGERLGCSYVMFIPSHIQTEENGTNFSTRCKPYTRYTHAGWCRRVNDKFQTCLANATTPDFV